MERLTIERLGHRGDGIAPGPVFAPLTLPGETVEGRIDDDRMTAPRIVTPSPDRVRAPCPHYRRCGGCLLQHASDGFVATWKTDVVKSALEAHGLPAPIRRFHTSPPASRRRAVLTGIRTKSGAIVGFNARASDTVSDIGDCHLLRPEILAALPALGALTRQAVSRKGRVRITVLSTEGGLDVAISDAKPLIPADWSGTIATARDGGLARLTWNGETLAEFASPHLAFGPVRIVPPPGAFLQATTEGEAVLRASVEEATGGAQRIADLFSGIGTFALPLAARAEVHAVEADKGMLAALDRAWRTAPGLKRVTTEARDLFRRPLEPGEFAGIDAAVIDPPRAGAEAQMRCVAAGGPRRLAMVSCNAVTFARDAKILCDAGYRLEWIDVIDQFRWSPHVELAAAFTRPESP